MSKYATSRKLDMYEALGCPGPMGQPILDPYIPVAARNLDILKRRVGPVTPVPQTKNDNAVIVEPGDQRRQVWVRPAYRDYRQAWLKVFMVIEPGVEIDHIYNHALARTTDYGYVRLFPVKKSTNRAHGSFIEKRLTAVGVPRGALTPLPELAFATNWMIAKMAGHKITKKTPGYDQPAALLWLVDENYI